MKKPISLALLAITWSSLSFAADIAIPADAVPDGGNSTVNQTNYRVPLPADSASVDEYVKWFATQDEAVRKNVMLQWISMVDARVTTSPKNKCIDIASAFTFKRISNSQYEVVCLAGSNGKELSHILKYEIDYNYMPASCLPTDAAVKLHFKDAPLRNSVQARNYYQLIAATCKIQVRAHDQSSAQGALPASYRLSAADVDNYLQADNSLKSYLAKGSDSSSVNSSSKATKNSAPQNGFMDGGFSNPAADTPGY